MPSKQARNYVFTLNNYVEAELVALRQSLSQEEKVRYAIFGYEVGESGTPHLQGYIAFQKSVTLTAAKKVAGNRAHLEVAKASEHKNREYCSKEGTTEVFGSPAANQGKRTDIDDFVDSVKTGLRDPKRLRDEHREVAARYPRFFDSIIRDHAPKPDLEYHPLRTWQADLNASLNRFPDKRTITFVVDEEGNQGKTWFAQYYCELHQEAFLLEPGKKADMAYALPDSCRVLFINCTREQTEFLNYSFLESCKDGMVFSSKYESRIKRYDNMHIVVMMNQDPDMTKLSMDRYKIIKLT